MIRQRGNTSWLSFRTDVRNLLFLLHFLFLTLVVPHAASAQGPATGTPPFGSFGGGPDVIDLANLNIHVSVPIVHKPGRGLDFNYALNYDSSLWYPSAVTGTNTWTARLGWGWNAQTAIATGYLSADVTQTRCFDVHHIPGLRINATNWVYHDSYGISHPFTGSTVEYDGCPGTTTSLNVVTTDGSGYRLQVVGGGPGTVTSVYGSVVNAPQSGVTSVGTSTDRNGNKISDNGSGVFTDTLGATALTVSTAAPSPTVPVTLTYTDPSGNPAHYTANYTNFTVATNFGVSGVSEFKSSAAVPLITSIVLPDGSQYSFSYEPTPSIPSAGACTPYAGTTCVTARIASVQFPTGGTISYVYYNNGGNFTGCTAGNNGVFSDGSASCLKRITPDGTWTYIQNKGTGAASTTLLTDAANNQTNIQFQGIYETERQVYQGLTSGTLLSTLDTCYNAASIPCTATAITLPITQRAVQTSIPSAESITLVGKNVAIYNSSGLPTEIDRYTFGSGSAPSTPTTKTLTTYASLGNITAFTQQIQVTNGSGVLIAQTNNNYDETTPVAPPTGTPPQWTNVTGSRGNLTSVQRCTNLASCNTSFVKSIMTYDTAGQIQSAKDPLNNQTTFAYADAFLDDDGTNPPTHSHPTSPATDAFATTVTPPMNGALQFKYYYSGQLALATDQNSNNSFGHFDSLGRLTSSYGPVLSGTLRKWLLNVYASSETQVDSYLDINDASATATASCTSCRHDEVTLDGLGRATTQQLVSDPEGATSVDTTYDSRGQVKTVSHAHRSTSSLTDGIETPAYDALGRTIKVTHPDSIFSQTYYGPTVTAAGGIATQQCASGTYGYGFPTLFVDESGRKRQIWTDGYGRTIEGDEPDGSGALTSFVCYAYDPLDNLLQVVHSATPAQTRTYAYDPLSRVTSVTIPERANSSGTNCAITFTYDSNSNLKTKTIPAPNQNVNCITGAVTITFNYDALNRLTSKTYSDATPLVKYGYDATAITGCPTSTTPPALTDSNPKGRMTAMCDSSGATSWAHDAAGRILTEKRTIIGTSAVTQTISYSYNLDGSVNTITYPSGKQVAYTVTNAQRLLIAKDPTTGGAQYALTASYGAIGALQSVITGQVSGGFGGVTESHTYNNRLEYTSTKAAPPTGAPTLDLTLAYNLNPPSGGQDNGSVTSITNNQDNGRNVSLTYDPLNRILKAVSAATTGADCWGQAFGQSGSAADDAVGNLLQVNQQGANNPLCTIGNLNLTVDVNNHINNDATFAYDAVGNMTKDGQSGITYTFDDEGRLSKITGITGAPWCYIYDGNGLRIAKKSGAASDCTGGTVTRIYWRSISGDSLTETDGSGSVTTNYSEYVFFTGRRIASRVTGSNASNTALFYYFADQLGSTRTITTGSGKNNDGSNQTAGQLCYDADFTPYGQEILLIARLQTTACTPSYKFAGYERDSETGFDYAFARYYSSRLGRFMSTDPLPGSIGDLQSHNAYAYVSNNPANFTDPRGLKKIPCYFRGDECIPGLGGILGAGLYNQLSASQANTYFGSTPSDFFTSFNSSACSVDGLESGCGYANSLLEAGAGAKCPNQYCNTYLQNGRGDLFFAGFLGTAAPNDSGKYYIFQFQGLGNSELPWPSVDEFNQFVKDQLEPWPILLFDEPRYPSLTKT